MPDKAEWHSPGEPVDLPGRAGDTGLQRVAELRWPELRSLHARLPPHRHETVTGPGQIGVAFTPHDDVLYESAGRTRRTSYPGGSVVCTGGSPIVWSDVRGPTEALEMYPSPDLVAGLLDTTPGWDWTWPVDRCVVGAVDPVVVGVASVLRRAHVGTTYLSETAVGALGLLLARTDLRRVHDLVEADLGGRLDLQRLAAATHLSTHHFARSFAASTGLAPHAFVTARRMDRARVMLAGSIVTVAEVAEAVGFDNLSHFRRVFRAHAGMSPAQYRQAV
jgi:AraC family transcriptional regulator